MTAAAMLARTRLGKQIARKRETGPPMGALPFPSPGGKCQGPWGPKVGQVDRLGGRHHPWPRLSFRGTFFVHKAGFDNVNLQVHDEYPERSPQTHGRP